MDEALSSTRNFYHAMDAPFKKSGTKDVKTPVSKVVSEGKADFFSPILYLILPANFL